VTPPDLTNRVRGGPTAGREPLNWERFLWLPSVCLLFVPLGWKQSSEEFRSWFFPTLLTLPIFLLIYWRVYHRRWRLTLIDLLPIALLGYILTAFNPAAFTYLAYAATFTPYVLRGLLRPLALSLALVALHAVEIVLIHQPQIPLTVISATLFITLSCVNGYFRVEDYRKNAALKFSHEEIRRLAAVAERERIGRDLHDLLGHTLSLIAIKSALAGKLIGRDVGAAAHEIEDVTRTARASLKQVRAAVAGIRSASLDNELDSTRALLGSSGVTLTCHRHAMALPVDTETALAMIVREAVTNIHRHAAANRAWIEISMKRAVAMDTSATTASETPSHDCSEFDVVLLVISDDGHGGVTTRGQGLAGIQSRVDSLGGALAINSASGRGTTLRVELPLDRGDYWSASVSPVAIPQAEK
jgi:two-component system, NarL family, sensor histidine kinase DesK